LLGRLIAPALATAWFALLTVACGRPEPAEVLEPVSLPVDALTARLDEPLPLDPSVLSGRLDNGLSYYVRANDEPANRAQIRLVVDVGSMLEDDDQSGLAHVLEHMAFSGTANFPGDELGNHLESFGMQLGSDVNASTSHEQTVFWLYVPTETPEPLEAALAIVEDWIDGFTLDSAAIEREREIVIEEWRRGRDAMARVQDRVLGEFLAGSRIAGRSPIGTLESLRTFDPEALRRFYDDWYRPDLMAVIVVGDFDATAVASDIRERFADVPAQPNARERVRHPALEIQGTHVFVATDPELASTVVSVAYPLARDSDWTVGGARRRLVESFYASMLTQRLTELSREASPPFVAGVASNTETYLWTNPAFVLLAFVPGGGVARGLDALLTESERAVRFGFTQAELERTRSQALRTIERQYASRDSLTSTVLADGYATLFLRGTPVPGIEYETALLRRFVNEVTLDEVNRVGRQWVSDSNRIVLAAGPEDENSTMPAEDELLAIVDSEARDRIEPFLDSGGDLVLLRELPEGSAIVAESEGPAGSIEWLLENGVRVILKPTDFDDDVIMLESFSPGGMSLATDEALVPARTSVRILTNAGLGNLDANELRQALVGKAASARPYIDESYEGISGSASPRDLETMLQLTYLWFTAPRIDDAAFSVFKAQAEQVFGDQDRNPDSAFENRFNEIMTQNHPRRRTETVAMLEAADPERSLRFFQDRFADAGDFTFILVGAIDLETTRPLVERYLGALPSIGREEIWRDVGVREPRGVIEDTIYKGREPVARTRIAMSTPIDLTDVRERALHTVTLRVLQLALQGVLRNELRATYDVSVSGRTSWIPEQRARIVIEFQCDPARVDDLVARVFSEIESLKTEGPDAGHVADTRESLLRTLEVNFEQNVYWIGAISSSERYGLVDGVTWINEYPTAIAALTPDLVREGMRRFVDTANYVRLTLLPEEPAP